ncbi:MAG: hypothetical protein JXB04_09600, partial [Kiritimatiellae bacterium]|nr:hypothetical protein [Kiritimatiellia bacterium]
TWATQHIVIVADAFSISCGLRLTLDVATNDGAGALAVRVDVDNGTCYQYAGAAEVNWSSNGYVSIAPILLSVGTNVIRLIAESGRDGTTSVLWDQIQVMPQFYIRHLACDGGTDVFPRATAEYTNYTGAASCWTMGRYLIGPTFTQTQQQIYDANTKDPAHGSEITPSSAANWLIGAAWPPYWFACHQAGSLNEALREAVYWMDYVPYNGTNSPVLIACGTNWAYRILRGFETDKKPYDGQGPYGSTYTVHGLWLNDPAFAGLGYNVYVAAEEMAGIYTPSGPGGSGYYLVVEPPPDPVELELAMASIRDATLELARPEGDADVAAYLQALSGDCPVTGGGTRTLGETTCDPSLLKVIPFALLQDAGFMAAFSQADAHNVYTVNADDPDHSYVLTAGGLRGPATTVFVLKMDPESGALRQATWQDAPGMYPPVSREAAIWLGLAGKADATLVSADLVYDPAADASAFFPRWRITYSQGGQAHVATVTQQADLGGDSDGDGMSDGAELYAGTDPTNASSGFAADGGKSSALGAAHGVIRWPSQAGRTYSLYRATDFATGFAAVESHIGATPPMNTYTDQLPAATTYYRVEVE